jgi:hypothetical protein
VEERNRAEKANNQRDVWRTGTELRKRIIREMCGGQEQSLENE